MDRKWAQLLQTSQAQATALDSLKSMFQSFMEKFVAVDNGSPSITQSVLEQQELRGNKEDAAYGLPPPSKKTVLSNSTMMGNIVEVRKLKKNSSRHDKNLSGRITAEVADVTLCESDFNAMRQNERAMTVDPHVRAMGTVGADGEPKVGILSIDGHAPHLEESGLPPPVFHAKDGLELQNVAPTPKSAEEEAVAEGQVCSPTTDHKTGDEEDVYVGAESKVASPGNSGSSGSQDRIEAAQVENQVVLEVGAPVDVGEAAARAPPMPTTSAAIDRDLSPRKTRKALKSLAKVKVLPDVMFTNTRRVRFFLLHTVCCPLTSIADDVRMCVQGKGQKVEPQMKTASAADRKRDGPSTKNVRI